MKRKNILLAASLFGSVAIVSTGFAAWVITGNATDTAQGSVIVDTVDDQRYSFSASVAEDEKIQFGAPSGTYENPSGAWLTSNNAVVDDLTAVVNITNFKQGGETTSITQDNLAATLSIKDSENSGNSVTLTNLLNTLVEQNYLSYSFVIASTGTGTGTVTLSFQWGTALGGESRQNPLVYFNSTYATYDTKLTNTVTVVGTNLDTSKTAADYAFALLSELEKFNGKTFVITLTTK